MFVAQPNSNSFETIFPFSILVNKVNTVVELIHFTLTQFVLVFLGKENSVLSNLTGNPHCFGTVFSPLHKKQGLRMTFGLQKG